LALSNDFWMKRKLKHETIESNRGGICTRLRQ
jgi:hypothetical protein